MELPADKIIEESQLVERQLYSLLSRVEQRRGKIPAAAADGEINQVMARGLQNTLKLTQEFTTAVKNKYSYTQQGAWLRTLADNLVSFQGMIGALEGNRNLSPLFDRIIDREYKELTDIKTHYHAIIKADSERLSALTLEEVQASEKPAPMMLPLAVGICLFWMPLIIMSEVLKETAKGLQPEPSPRPLLRLVHST